MKNRHLLFLLPVPVLLLSQCIVVEEPGSTTGSTGQQPSGSQAGFTQPLTATSGSGSVTVREGNRTLSVIRTALPNVEETRWYSEQEQIAVKSRGNHGPATVQLFDSRTGRQLGSVPAYEAANGPAWARGMAE
ncbi:hypothetical protein [Haloferula sp. A504]|uniref:hypothetical protein n=1 Tax=Haloferula sp. A504 TaxID=3373601 RepID=UPI0031BE0444|nr:hypothetical protein [Verrucomicrobiaceae bacterium E54]